MHVTHQEITYLMVLWVMTPCSLVDDANILL
jgi:hypothetical protein